MGGWRYGGTIAEVVCDWEKNMEDNKYSQILLYQFCATVGQNVLFPSGTREPEVIQMRDERSSLGPGIHSKLPLPPPPPISFAPLCWWFCCHLYL